MSKQLRSYDWFGKSGKIRFVHPSWLRNQGFRYNTDVLTTLESALQPPAGIAVLKVKRCEQGAIITPSAASSLLMKNHRHAIGFETLEDYHARINIPERDIDGNCIVVLKGVRPVGRTTGVPQRNHYL